MRMFKWNNCFLTALNNYSPARCWLLETTVAYPHGSEQLLVLPVAGGGVTPCNTGAGHSACSAVPPPYLHEWDWSLLIEFSYNLNLYRIMKSESCCFSEAAPRAGTVCLRPALLGVIYCLYCGKASCQFPGAGGPSWLSRRGAWMWLRALQAVRGWAMSGLGVSCCGPPPCTTPPPSLLNPAMCPSAQRGGLL